MSISRMSKRFRVKQGVQQCPVGISKSRSDESTPTWAIDSKFLLAAVNTDLQKSGTIFVINGVGSDNILTDCFKILMIENSLNTWRNQRREG